MIFQELRLIDDAVPRDGAWNMAIDEALSETVTEPTLRLYCWKERTVSFGYFEKFREIEKMRPGFPSIRRWTGGGLVEHGSDLTYSLIVPAWHSLWSVSRAESYVSLHRGLQSVLARGHGLVVELAEETAKTGAGCFLRPVAGDLTMAGRKVAGAAQRRGRRFLLHQGSLQNLALDHWKSDTFARAWSDLVFSIPLSSSEENRAAELVSTRYGTRRWQERF